MNEFWKIEFLLLEASRRPEQREAWLQLAAEWIIKAYLDRKHDGALCQGQGVAR